MDSEGLEAFTRDIYEKSASTLRVVAYHEAGDSEVLFLRDDVLDRSVRDSETLEDLLETWQQEAIDHTEDLTLDHTHGDLNAVVTTFEDAQIIHFPFAEDKGVSISLDAVAGKRLNEFVMSCRESFSEQQVD